MHRIVPIEEVIETLKKDYSGEEIEVIFAYHKDHPIEDCDGTLRWVQTLDWKNTPDMNPNAISDKYHTGKMTQEEYMDYNRQIGYSSYGYWEVFVFNDRFDDEQYEKDMIAIKTEKRDSIINNIIE